MEKGITDCSLWTSKFQCAQCIGGGEGKTLPSTSTSFTIQNTGVVDGYKINNVMHGTPGSFQKMAKKEECEKTCDKRRKPVGEKTRT